MIASIKRPQPNTRAPAWHASFLAMLPAIRRTAQITFRKVCPELREELVQEIAANCFTAYARLVEIGREDLAFPSALARFAIAQVRVGRRVGNRLRIRDVMSEYAQHRKNFQVEPLHYFDQEENCWQEIVVEDKRATPAEIAACRIDFASWLRLLPRRRRKIASRAGWWRDHKRRREEVRPVGGESLTAPPMAKGKLGGVSRRTQA